MALLGPRRAWENFIVVAIAVLIAFIIVMWSVS
jgi:hypothetical protein